MVDVIPFDFDGSAVRVILQADEPWFVAKDVCDVLGLSNPSVAVSGLDEDERAKHSLGRQGEANTVSESGLYALVFSSRKEKAKQFRKWVTGEVLPAIRKKGGYCTLLPAPVQNGALSLKPSFRVQALSLAVQVVRMQSGTEADVNRLYEDYCSKLAATREDEAKARGASGFNLWADTYLTATTDNKERTRASVLYDRYRHWAHQQNQPALSMKGWGTRMKERYDHIKSGVYWYFVTHS